MGWRLRASLRYAKLFFVANLEARKRHLRVHISPSFRSHCFKFSVSAELAAAESGCLQSLLSVAYSRWLKPPKGKLIVQRVFLKTAM